MTAPAHWRWHIIPALAAAAFARKPDIPLPLWAARNVFLDRKMTSKPGLYDPDEFPWTWEFQEIIRTRHVFEEKLADGSVILIDPPPAVAPPNENIARHAVQQVTAMKCTVSGFTEGALNGIRYCAKHDPQNVIFSIDNRVQAGEVNEIRLQPTLRRLGEKIFTADDDDAGKFLLKLQRMLVYFLGSYSAGAFSQKFCELAIGDEVEEHGKTSGDTSSVENLRSRIKSSARGLLVLMSKPKMSGGPIHKEYEKGSCHIAEVPCPHCSEEVRSKNDELRRQSAAGLLPSSFILPTSDLAGYQRLEQENMIFGHCKNVLGEWDFERVLRETYFKCVHCEKPIEESWKRWMNDRSRRRWRRTNFEKAEPGHISFQISDFYQYHEKVKWGVLAMEYIRSKSDPVARQGYRNHHEGLPYEVRETKTAVADILVLRGAYKLGQIPWIPHAIILGADVGQAYVKYDVLAFRRTSASEGEAAVIDYGQGGHPDDIARVLQTKKYQCREDGVSYPIGLGFIDAKWNRLEVHKACLRLPRRLFPCAGISADLSARSISFNRVPNRPRWFGIMVFVDRDAKNELYIERVGAWVHWIKCGSRDDERPLTPRLWYPEDLNASDKFVIEHTKEPLIEVPAAAHSAKQFVFKRIGANHWGDCTKVALTGWRFFTMGDAAAMPAGNGEPAGETEG